MQGTACDVRENGCKPAADNAGGRATRNELVCARDTHKHSPIDLAARSVLSREKELPDVTGDDFTMVFQSEVASIK